MQKSSHLAVLLAAFVASMGSAEDSVVDFNRDIRPIFNQYCVECHGGVKQAGDLSFVYADQTMAVLDPGDAESSYLIERVTAEEDERMPPPEHGPALTSDAIEQLSRWIDQGAEWGEHWAFVPPAAHDPPLIANDEWSHSRVDRFVLARLRSAGIEPAPAAPPDRWLRRVSLALTGLPPTPRERSRFLASERCGGDAAYASEVDRLLGSPAFGERWASVWLDAVRYADSRGLGQDGRRTMWKYRDWVIRALNDDLAYDEFTTRQLAGDLLPEPAIDDLVATAGQRLTQTNEEGGTDDEMFRVEAVIDRVNTVWQTWQGLSFGCVQCHSHPYDPIRHEEYYQFLAFFNNTVDTDLTSDDPVVMAPVDDRLASKAMRLDREIESLANEDWSAGYALLSSADSWSALTGLTATTNNNTQVVVSTDNQVEEYQTVGTVSKETTVTLEAELPKTLTRLTAIRFDGLPENAAQAVKDSEWGFVLSHFEAELINANGEVEAIEIGRVIADEPDPILDPQLSLQAKNPNGFGAYSRIHYPRSAAFVLSSPRTIGPGERLRVSLSQNVFELGAFPLVAHRGRIFVSGDERFTHWWHDQSQRESRARLQELRQQRQAIKSVRTPIMAERMKSLARPTYVFERGNYLTKASEVTAQTPEFLGVIEQSASSSLNRLDLARWLTAAENPLTARVMVNRVWSQLFGIGIVETQEDFGSSGDPPSHPLLLDDLATRFQTEMSWSLKALIRELVLSSTYRQSASVTPARHEVDPRNRLLGRGPRQRLPAESIRDQALAVAGLLSDRQLGSPAYPPLPDGVWKPFQGSDRWTTPDGDHPDRYRRTVYTYTKRTIPYPVMSAFDAPSRESCSMRRRPSNTPLQALMTLNDATFVEASEALAERMRAASSEVSEQLRWGFLLAVCREPTANELAELRGLVDRVSVDDEPPDLTTVASVLLNLDEVLTQ